MGKHLPLRGYVVICGPDGAGKTAISDALASRAASQGTPVKRAHWRPGLIPPIQSKSGGRPGVDPHCAPPRGSLATVLRIVLLFIDFAVGAALRWRRSARNGLLVVERGWFDMVVDPRRYRLPSWAPLLLERIGQFLPRADVAVVLTGNAEILADRKGEIDAHETRRQILNWQRLGCRAARRVVVVDTTEISLEDGVDQICSATTPTERRLRWRRVPLAAPRLDLRAAGQAERAFAVHRTYRRSAHIVTPVGRLAWRARLTRSTTSPVDSVEDLLFEIGLPLDGAVAFRSSQPHRWVIGVAVRNQLAAVIKIGLSDDVGLVREAERLAVLRCADLPFTVPEPIYIGRWHEHRVVATEAIPHRSCRMATLEDAECVATTLVRGLPEIGALIHGDLVPWNLLSTRCGLGVIDWEQSEMARAPLHDLAHFAIRAGSHLGDFTPAQVVRALTYRDSPGWRHLTAVDADPATAPEYVRLYLSATPPSPGEESFRRHVAELIHPAP